MTTDAVKFGRFIRRIRKERNLTLGKVGKSINKSAAYMCDIEKGRRGQNMNPVMLVKLAEVLDVPLNTMFNQADIEVDVSTVKYRAFLRMTRNKQRSARIVKALEGCYSNVNLLISETKGLVSVAPIAKSVMDSLRELDIAISVA